MSELFGSDTSVISRHLSKIFEINELVKDSAVANFATAAAMMKKRFMPLKEY